MAAAKIPFERSTRQKSAIRDVFTQAEHPLSIDEIHAAAQDLIAGLSLPTVYRSVRGLLEEGFVTAVELPGRPAVYETTARGHHHHFVCDDCARVYELEGCTAIDVKIPAGFLAKNHEIVINGLCKRCEMKTSGLKKRK